ncbi:MAG: OB-fold nucleic acid binding domain-containing protein, partial [Pseudomonadota bacterium]
VHPYLKRRNGLEPVEYPSDALKEVLKRTLGVPLFQEQAMQIATVAAGFDPGEADQLRRSLGAFRGPGSVEKFHARFIDGALSKGYDRDFAERVFRQLEGFSGYGFPESHAASFAHLVYASAWLKRHYPEVYCCAILNSQPMGFYAPAQLVRDARAHGVEVRPVCVNHSFWDNTLEPDGTGGFAVRLGFRQVKGFKEEDGVFLTASRGNGYRDVSALNRRAGLDGGAIAKLAEADAFAALDLSRRDALWRAKAIKRAEPMPLFAQEDDEGISEVKAVMPQMTRGEEVFEDYVSTRLTLRDHPIKLLRPRISNGRPLLTAKDLETASNGGFITISGLVITRQRPGTASGVIFITLEDETGASNIIVWPKTFEKHRREVMTGRLLRIRGKLQREGVVTHVISAHIDDLSYLLDQLGDVDAADGRIDPTWSTADEARRPVPLEKYWDREGKPGSKRVQPNRIQMGRAPTPRARHPRAQANVLFPSRDFH